MNCFHPDYVKTYMPEMMASIRLEEKQRLNGLNSGQKTRKTRESVMGIGACNIAAFPKTKSVKQK